MPVLYRPMFHAVKKSIVFLNSAGPYLAGNFKILPGNYVKLMNTKDNRFGFHQKSIFFKRKLMKLDVCRLEPRLLRTLLFSTRKS